MRTKNKKWLIRLFSLCLFVLSGIWGSTNRKTGVCLGDSVFTYFGLNAWSERTHGTHYPGVIALICMVVSFYIFAYTTTNRKRTFILLVLFTSVISILLSFI